MTQGLFIGALREVRGILGTSSSRQAIQFGAPKASKKKEREKKKTWGMGKTNVRVKKGPEGAIYAPLSSKNGPGVPVTLCQTQRSEKRSRKAVSKRPRTMALPGPSLGRGAGAMTRGYASFDDGSAPSSWCETAAKHNKRGKNNTRQKENRQQKPLPPRVQKTGPQKGASNLKPPQSTERIQKTPKRTGPRMAPRQNARRKGRTAKTGDKPGAAGTKTRKRNKNTRCVWGVPCYYLSFLS